MPRRLVVLAMVMSSLLGIVLLPPQTTVGQSGPAIIVQSVAQAPAMSTAASFDATADTYVRSGADNTNEGAATLLRLQASGDNRALVRFDQAAMQAFINGGTVVSATLRLTITTPGNNWGPSGRTVDAHRLIVDWAEGNGFAEGSPSTRGTGSGATWNCAIDSDISNQQKNCSGATEWEMGQPNQPQLHTVAQGRATDRNGGLTTVISVASYGSGFRQVAAGACET